MQQAQNSSRLLIGGALALIMCVSSVAAVITVQIGGATRLTSLSRSRDRYSCYWDCDLVGCQIARDDDECAYDCEKICRVRYDYAGRSGVAGAAEQASAAAASALAAAAAELKPKSALDALIGKSGASSEPQGASNELNDMAADLAGAGTSVRLHLPRNASARNFAIWERCSPDVNTGKLTEKPFNL